MDFNQELKAVFFDIQEKIPLGERVVDISTIQNVEIIPEIEMISDHSSYRIKGFLNFYAEYEGRRDESSIQEVKGEKKASLFDEEPLEPLVVEKSAQHWKKATKEINYRIPVDITLPADRVDEDGIVLEITSLDYDIALPNHLLVNAKLSLTGILEEEAAEPVETSYESNESKYDEEAEKIPAVETNAFWGNPTDIEYEQESFKYLWKKKDKENKEAKPEVKENIENKAEKKEKKAEVNEKKAEANENKVEVNENVQEAPKKSDELLPEKVEATKQQALAQNSGVLDNKIVQQSQVEEQVQAAKVEDPLEVVQVSADLEESQEEEPADSVKQKQEVDEKERDVKVSISRRISNLAKGSPKKQEAKASSATTEAKEETKAKSTTVQLLSQFLSNREETYTKMKVCLVQPNETLEQIALKYSVSQQEILSINHLESGSMIGGRVLKIPVKKGK